MLTHKQSFLLFQELYHRQFINMKDTESATVVEIAAKNPLPEEKGDRNTTAALLKEKFVSNLFVVITKLVLARALADA